MDAKQFLAEFGHVANAKGGVKRLRELVLQFAVQGRLVPPENNVKASNDYRKDVLKLKKKLVSEKKLPREKPFPKVGYSELPINRPEHWSWARFGEFWQLLSGRDLTKNQYNDSESGIPYITGASNFEKNNIIINRWTESPIVISIENDLLITCKGTIGKTIFNTIGDVHIARQIMAIRDFSECLNTAFLKIWLDTFVFELIEKSKSMIPGFSRNDLLYAVFPLPPLEEQARIVTKVNELMVLCDQLEVQQQQKRKLQNLLRQTSLQAVANASNAVELKQHWQRLHNDFELFFSEAKDMDELRNLILDLGIQGILTNIDSKDESAKDLLRHLYSNKQKLLLSGKIKRSRRTKADILEKKYVIPKHWERGLLEDIFQFIDYRGKTPPKMSSGVILVTAKNVRPGRINTQPKEYISVDSYHNWMTRGFPKKGDILITTEAPLGNIARIVEEPNFALAQRVINLQPYAEIDTKCLVYFMMSPLFQEQLFINATGMTAKGIKAAKLKQIKIPIPPKQEQGKIVHKIKTLLTICEKLECKLMSATTTAEHLAATTIASLTGIHITKKDKPLKIPQTELIAPLQLGKNKPSKKDTAPLASLLVRHNGEMQAKDLWQHFGSEIDVFYAQLKTEVKRGWIDDPSYIIAENNEDKENQHNNPKLYPDGKLVAKVIEKGEG